MYVEAIKCLVRPIITYLIVLALVIVVVFCVVKFADMEMAKVIVHSFLILVTAITSFWFGQRHPSPPTSPIP